VISDELIPFCESGVSLQVGTRDAQLFPDTLRAYGLRVEPGAGALTVFLPDATSAQALANLRDNGRIALCLARIADHRTIQIKGRAVDVRPACESDLVVIRTYRARLAEALATIGLPTRLGFRLSHWPAHAVRVEVESLFDATPGPGAGERLRGGGAPA
jgi:hypothetical protein